MSRKQVTKENEQQFSKFLSFILRHKPEEIELKLEEDGWVDLESLIKAINNHEASKWKIDIDMLEYIVANDGKQRYSFNSDKTKIRANQGHSIKDLKMNFEKVDNPPEVLYHGTSKENAKLIMDSGILKSMSRQMVHLSKDIETASNVGNRHGKLEILKIDTKKAVQSGVEFFISENGVYLVKELNTEFIYK